jgi:hypothetical protein
MVFTFVYLAIIYTCPCSEVILPVAHYSSTKHEPGVCKPFGCPGSLRARALSVLGRGDGDVDPWTHLHCGEPYGEPCDRFRTALCRSSARLHTFTIHLYLRCRSSTCTVSRILDARDARRNCQMNEWAGMLSSAPERESMHIRAGIC